MRARRAPSREPHSLGPQSAGPILGGSMQKESAETAPINVANVPQIELTLPIEGMTCASCVNRIERYLRRTDGVVEANVNLATERATVTIDPTRAGRSELVGAVEAAGYDVRPEAPAEGTLGEAARGRPVTAEE